MEFANGIEYSEELIVKRFKDGESVSSISRDIRVYRGRIQWVLESNGVECIRRRKNKILEFRVEKELFEEDERRLLMRMYSESVSIDRMARELRTNRTKILRYLLMKGLSMDRRGWKKKFFYKGVVFKSSWEVKVAKWLDSMNIRWEYETEAFETSVGWYWPDFKLIGMGEYLEVKGYLDDVSRKKMNDFVSSGKKLIYISGKGRPILSLERHWQYC